MKNKFYSGFYYEDPKDYRWLHWILTESHPLEHYDKTDKSYYVRGKLDRKFKMDIDVDPDEILEWEFEIRKKILYISNVYNK